MKLGRIYFRKSGKALAIEGKTNSGKSLHIYTLGDAEKMLQKLMDNASFFTKEKRAKIEQIFRRIAFRSKRGEKQPPELPLINIVRTSELDAGKEEKVDLDDEISELAERGKNEIIKKIF